MHTAALCRRRAHGIAAVACLWRIRSKLVHAASLKPLACGVGATARLWVRCWSNAHHDSMCAWHCDCCSCPHGCGVVNVCARWCCGCSWSMRMHGCSVSARVHGCSVCMRPGGSCCLYVTWQQLAVNVCVTVAVGTRRCYRSAHTALLQWRARGGAAACGDIAFKVALRQRHARPCHVPGRLRHRIPPPPTTTTSPVHPRAAHFSSWRTTRSPPAPPPSPRRR
jgi:hypothetical protein